MIATRQFLIAFSCSLALAACAHGADEAAPVLLPAQPVRFARIPPDPIPLPPTENGSGDALLTLAEAEAMALANHPAMREAEGLVRAAQGEWLQVGLRPNPQIGYSGEEVGIEKTSGMQGGFISKEFVTAGKLGLNRAAALGQVAAAEQRVERTRRQIVTTVRTYYYESLAAERSVALAMQLQGIATQAFKASELRLQALEGTRAALLQSQVASDSATLLVETAANRRDGARRRLGTILAIEPSALPALEDTLGARLPLVDWTTTRDRLLAESPELAELRAEVDRARWQVQRECAGRIPNVMIAGGAQYDAPSDDTIGLLQISFPLQVFDRNQGNIARAYGRLTAAQGALDSRELALVERLAAAVRDYDTAIRRVKKYAESILPAARQSLDLVSQAYEQGELEYLDILSTQRIYTETNLTYLDDLETAWKQWAEIDGLLVGPLPESGG